MVLFLEYRCAFKNGNLQCVFCNFSYKFHIFNKKPIFLLHTGNINLYINYRITNNPKKSWIAFLLKKIYLVGVDILDFYK